MLKAVFFDIDDTLYSTTEFACRARTAAVRRMIQLGLNLDLDTCMRELEEVIAEFSSNYSHHFDKLLARLGPTATGDANPAILVAGAVAAYHATKDTDLVPFPGVLDTFRQLASSPLLVGIITEGLAVKQAEKLLRLGLYPYVAPGAVFISDQIGISKPNPKLYRRTLNVLDLEPSQAMYVGNRVTHDVDPPASLGMATVLFLHAGKYAGVSGKFQPDYTIQRFEELATILHRDFAVNFP